MTRLKKIFNNAQRPVLNVYCTAGFPSLESTIPVMKSLAQNGADIVELGMPYSDPLADGPVIQHSSTIALKNGMTIATLFEQLKGFRKEKQIENLGVLLMGYMNPVLQYGFEKFCSSAAEVGVDGLIIPDLPPYEFETMYGNTIRKYNLDFVFLVTPETSEERIKQLDGLSSGFLYAVSSSSTTGKDKNMQDVSAYLQRLKRMNLKNPLMAGFGIKDKQSFDAVCSYTSGAIIGTAYIKALDGVNDVDGATRNFLKKIL